MKLHKFRSNWHWDGRVKYHEGSHYEPNDETRVAVAAGHAEEVDGSKSQVCDHFAKAPAAAPAEEAPPADKGAKKGGKKGDGDKGDGEE